jgi:hypothetical protein
LKRFATLFCAFLLYSTLLQADDVNWVDWHTVLPNSDIQGTVIVGDSEVTVTYSGERAFVQLSCGINYWNPSTPYISTDVPNPPPDCDIIALSQATIKTLTFSEPVSNLFFAVVSLNGNGYRFDRDFNILSFGRGYWGDGTLTKEINLPTYDLIGTGEPHGVIQIVGSFSSVSWTSLSNENWNGFSIAFENTTANLSQTVTIAATTNGEEPATDGLFTVSSSLVAETGGLTVNYEVDVPSTATAGVDYHTLSGAVNILEGETTAVIPVTVIDDATIEVTKTVTVNLTSGSGYALGSPSVATVDITDDDVAPPPPPQEPAIPVPAMAAWGSLLMVLVLGLFGIIVVRRMN